MLNLVRAGPRLLKLVQVGPRLLKLVRAGRCLLSLAQASWLIVGSCSSGADLVRNSRGCDRYRRGCGGRAKVPKAGRRRAVERIRKH